MSLDALPPDRAYVVPRYRAEDAAFHHFLHGTVPGHQIDFMYCPDVPQGALRQTHVGHLARLIKYIEPRDGAPYAFAIGNLSRDDVQHEPGHGGIVILFALRVPGVIDHAGRDMPPYAHGVVAVDRELTYGVILHTATALYRRFLEREGADWSRDFYRAYAKTMQDEPGSAPGFLAKAIAGFDDLPSPRESEMGWDYEVDEGSEGGTIVLVYDEPMEFGVLAHRASALAALLYRSNIKWTSLSTGRGVDIAGGMTIRFVPRSEASGERECRQFDLDALPEDEEALAAMLFGAKRRGHGAASPAAGWREALAAQRAAAPEAAGEEGQSEAEVVDDAAATLPMAALIPALGGAEARGPAGRKAGAHGRRGREPGSMREDATAPVDAPGGVPGGDRELWIIVAAALAATAVIVVVVLTAGMSVKDAPPLERDTGTGGVALTAAGERVTAAPEVQTGRDDKPLGVSTASGAVDVKRPAGPVVVPGERKPRPPRLPWPPRPSPPPRSSSWMVPDPPPKWGNGAQAPRRNDE